MAKYSVWMVVGFLTIAWSTGMATPADAKTDRVARKHLVLGDALYKQGKIDQAVDEWKIALAIDPKMSKAESRIRQAQKDGGVDFSEGEEEVEVADDTQTAVAQPDSNVPKLKVELLEVQKLGGRPSKVIMNAGANAGVRVGLNGVIVDGSGLPLAAFVIKIIDPEKSLADVTSSNREITEDAVAVINMPQ